MQIITVYGVTKQTANTTIAEELSLISLNKGYKTLLVDLDIHKGDVTERLQLQHYPNISDWCEDIYLESEKSGISNVEYTRPQWARFLQKHQSGLDVLASNNNPKLPGSDNIYNAIKIICNSIKKSDYDGVVVDMSNTPTSFNFMVLEESDIPMLVVDTFRYNVVTLKHLLWDLKIIQFPVEKLKLLFNREASPLEDPPEAVAREFGLPVIGVLSEMEEKSEGFHRGLENILEKIMQN